ncbi:methyltransferase family protein [Stackebrandtia albiflava]|uniref:Methyltransferase family protein n=1 Tax=Stackebrandtia albiflava TaxID=406432 RepID=A0A562UQQ2_9ACTN|nr:class I SAM-dependent methyltransferase [Stackebrandtia albiflava]TWJ07955.1 methyltransferase family protein [Stackebrandtia albiflava]
MDGDELIERALSTDFEGWDFSVLSGRLTEGDPDWDYETSAAEAVATAEAVLDMGTGGGEFLARLLPAPGRVTATESYPPNVPVARRRLEPLGVEVVATDADRDDVLPFEDARFDLVLNRHESFDAREVARILRPGGVFLTQQVGGGDLSELNAALGGPANPYGDWNLDAAAGLVAEAGLTVTTRREAFPPGRFTDVGAVVLYLRMAPWQIDGWDPAAHRDRLSALHDRMTADGGLAVRHHRFLVVARKPD